jgi:hypothetical protein
MEPGFLLALEGASAAGKTTVASAVARTTGATVLPEAYRRLVPAPSLEFRSSEELLGLERTLLAEEVLRYAEASDRIHAGESVIADTGFLGPLTYTFALVRDGRIPSSVLATLVAESRSLGARGELGFADAYVYLDASPGVRAERARSDPAGAPPQVAARHRELGTLERAFYFSHFAPLWGGRFRVVGADGTAPEVAAEIVRALPGLVESPPATVRFEDVLGALTEAASLPEPPRGNR